MTTEPQRLQYLEAMGLTAWTARYRMPNARPTEACEWELPVPDDGARQAPGERLHALLDAPAEPSVPAPAAPASPAAEPRERPPAGERKARALLGGLVPEAASEEAAPDAAPEPARSVESDEPREALRFALQVACLDGRWLVVQPGEAAPSPLAQRLLANLLRAAGVTPEHPPAFEAFHWPQIEGLDVQAPLDEARQGLGAFLAGRARRGWAPERLLVFGDEATLTRVLAIDDGRSTALDLPAWQGPALETLAGSAEAKRDLWPRLLDWRREWHGEAKGEAKGDA
ncbi:hypothetical protein FIU88_15270 [Halomonas sp. THAF12]|uniref:hypothetical protein n=1 Tax=Halomonas sp. THAF12 TaxID=2587849 RepID=UPI0012690660|nr:hypothetical protein [Halomonas sp. THAF12]QFT86322.1 hypothetical protein FIU88_15270 [Halomonas sp. THAF12]